MTKGDEEGKPWVIRDVPEETRREVKVYAAQHGVNVADALEALVHTALQIQLGLVPGGQNAEKEMLLLPGGAGSILTQADVMLVVNALSQVALNIKQRIEEGIYTQLHDELFKELGDDIAPFTRYIEETGGALAGTAEGREADKKWIAGLVQYNEQRIQLKRYYRQNNDTRAVRGEPPISFGEYLTGLLEDMKAAKNAAKADSEAEE